MDIFAQIGIAILALFGGWFGSETPAELPPMPEPVVMEEEKPIDEDPVTPPKNDSLQLSATSGTAPFTVSIQGPSLIMDKIKGCVYSIGFFGPSGNGLNVDWGDGSKGPGQVDESNRGKSCTNAVRTHTYSKPGTYVITLESWHPGPTDMAITDWEGTATVVVK